MNSLIANKNIADALKSWLGLVTIFLAGAYTLLEYIEHKQAVRVERSLGYVEHYRDSNTAEAKLSLNQLLVNNQQTLITLLNNKYTDESELNNAFNKLILAITETPDVQRNLEIVFTFFEEAAICSEHQLCDKEVIQSFFLNDAKSLFNSFYPYVCQLRKQWKNDTVYLKLQNFYVKPGKDICQHFKRIE